jgi:WD40 repeat protein
VLARDTDEILALTAVETSAGSVLVIVGRRNGVVEAWDLALGVNIARWHPERVEAVQQVMLAELPDGPTLVAAWFGGQIGAFQLTGEQVYGVGDEGKVTAMCLAERAGRVVCVTAHDDRRLVMRTLPQLDVVQEIRGATRAKIYGLAVVTHHGERVLLSSGDSLCGDDGARDVSMLRMWSLDSLSPLWEDHLERTGALHFIEKHDLIGRTVTVISQDGWGHFQLWDLNQGTLLLDGDRASSHAWVYEHDGKPFVLEAKYGELTARHIELRTDHEPPALALGSSVGPIETEGARFSSLVRLHGRAALLAATGGYVRVWDLQDLLQEALHSGDPAATVRTRAAPSVHALAWGKERPGMLYAGTRDHVFALDAETGTLLWDKEPGHEGRMFIKALALTPPQDRLVAADDDGCLHVLDLDAEGQAEHFIKLGGQLERMCIARWQGQTFAFATVDQGRGWGVRIWEIDRREEVPTQSPYRLRAGESAFQLRAGEEDKVMRGLAVAPCATGVRFAFASKYGKVMVADLGASGAEHKFSPWPHYDEWPIPANDGEYVNVLASSRGEAGFSGAGHELLLAAATEYGTIAIWNFLDGTLLARRWRAYLGDIRAMQFCYRAGQAVLATGGDDGVLRVWTTGLDELLRIEIDEPIYALTFLGTDRIAIGGPHGVLMLALSEGFS